MTREVKESAIIEVLRAALESTENRVEAFDTLCLAIAGLVNKGDYAHQEIADKVIEALNYYALRQS